LANRDPDSRAMRFDLILGQLDKLVGSISERGASRALVKFATKSALKIVGTDLADGKILIKSLKTADIP